MGHCRNRTGRIRQLSSFWENRMFALHSPDTLCPSQAKKGHHSLSCSLDTATCPTQNWHDAPQPLPNVHKIVKERQGFHQDMQSLEARRARQKPFPQADRTGPVSQTAGDCQATQGRKKTFPPECKLNCPSRHGTNNADRSHTLKRQQEWDQVRAQKKTGSASSPQNPFGRSGAAKPASWACCLELSVVLPLCRQPSWQPGFRGTANA